MDSLIDIIVPTFINCHLFWIIPKKNLLLRSAINRALRAKIAEQIKALSVDVENMVAVNVDNIWARAIIEQIIENSNKNQQFICWLPDYGVKRIVNYVFYLPEDLKKYPHLAKQASLHNVVNLMTGLTFTGSGYELELKKTTSCVQGVRKVAIDCIEKADSLFFYTIDEDEFNTYGDIIFVDHEGDHQSLTEFLVKKNLLGIDENMFESVEENREQFKDAFYEHSHSWYQELDKTETKNLSEIIFNKEENNVFPPMEFFERKPFNNNMINRYV